MVLLGQKNNEIKMKLGQKNSSISAKMGHKNTGKNNMLQDIYHDLMNKSNDKKSYNPLEKR